MSQEIRKSSRTPLLRDSVEQVWLAGLGALAMTEAEGTRFFKTLVKRGEGFERSARNRLDEAVTAARQAPGTAITRIEEGFDGAMSGVLQRLGVPTKSEINGLARRVEGLANTLETRTASTRRPAGRRKSTATATVRKSRAAPPPQ